MDVSLTSGLTMSVIGIGTVFVALVVLVAAVSLTGRLIARNQSLAAADQGSERSVPPSKLKSISGVDLRVVAIAAFAAHLRRRAETRPRHEAISRWSIAGRLHQMAPFER